jgi:hypothetical protein
MKRSLLLSSILIAATSTTALATTNTFQATIIGFSEPTIEQTTPLHFGKVALDLGSECIMDNTGVVSGDCDAADANISIGAITVSGLAPNSAMNITVSGSVGSNVTFLSSSIANDGTSNVPLTNAAITGYTTSNDGDDIEIAVFGTMTVNTALSSGIDYTADYTVEVDFQ